MLMPFQSSFFAHFMCFDIPMLLLHGDPTNVSNNGIGASENHQNLTYANGTDAKTSNHHHLLLLPFFSLIVLNSVFIHQICSTYIFGSLHLIFF